MHSPEHSYCSSSRLPLDAFSLVDFILLLVFTPLYKIVLSKTRVNNFKGKNA